MTKDDANFARQIRNDLFLLSAEPDFTEFDINDLFRVLAIADDAYHNDTPLFADEEYDAIRLFCETSEPNNLYFLGVGSEVRGGKVKLPYTMGSLTQTYLGGETMQWIDRYNLRGEDIVITEKLDGMSVLLIYGPSGDFQIAFTRGDGYEGADITRHVAKMPCVPKTINGPAAIRAEIIFKKADWERIKTEIRRPSNNQPYKNARNATAGLMNASESAQLAYDNLSVVAYEILTPCSVTGSPRDKTDQLALLETSGFMTPHYFVVKGEKATDEFLTKALNILRSKTEYEIDGIVIDVDSRDLRSKINPSKETLNPEYARKFKVADASNQAIATVTQVEWRISKNGYLKPRVHIEPVELVGVTVTHATGFNAKFVKDNGIGVGAKVRITRSGDVIPFIQEVVHSVTPDMPIDDAAWTSTGVDLVITNADTSDKVRLEQLIDFAAKMGFEHIGEGNIEKIYNAGYTTPTQLVLMTEFEIRQAIGSVNGTKIWNSIRERTHNVPWYIVAGAYPSFGRGVGQRKMKKLYEAFGGDMTKLYSTHEIAAVDGFEIKTASKIAKGYNEFWDFVEQTGITFAEYEKPVTGSLTGQTFLFTGFRSSDLEAQIQAQGGKMSSSVSSKLTYLVAADVNDSSGKLKKARDIGTKIISKDELVAMLG